MRLIGSISSITQFNNLKNELDGIMIGQKDYSTTISYDITTEELKAIIEMALSYQKEVILQVDIMPNNDDLQKVVKLISSLKYPLTYLVQDLGLFLELKNLGYQNIIYAASTLLTNYEVLDFYLKQGFKACMPSLEIPLNDIIVMQQKLQKGLFFKAFGYHSMMHSKRKLISTYQEHIEMPKRLNNKNSYLIEEIRDGKYPIIENQHGTIIFRSSPVSYLNRINELRSFDYLFLDNLFIADKTYQKIVKIYRSTLLESLTVEEALNSIEALGIHSENTFIDIDTVYLKEEF